jgi:hypothetical protein
VPGSTPPSTSHATRATRVVVFPLPAGATTSNGPSGAVAAARWSGANLDNRSTTDGWDIATMLLGRDHPRLTGAWHPVSCRGIAMNRP